MTSNAEKTLKKQIFQSVYKDNVELQEFELGKAKSPGRVSKVSKVSKEIGTRGLGRLLVLLLALTLAGGRVGRYLDSSQEPELIAEAAVVTAVSSIPPLSITQEQEQEQERRRKDISLLMAKPKWLPGFFEEDSERNPFYARSSVDWSQLLIVSETDQQPGGNVDNELLFLESLQGLVDTQIPLARLFDLQVHTIVIDPGHGGRDPGTIGPRTGLAEKEITLDVARMLKKQLEENSPFRVLLTRDSDVTISLKERVAFVREQQADLFVSIHVNSLPSESDDLVETFFFGAQKDARAAMLAEKENRGSDYGLGDFNEMIRALGNTLKTQESQRLATFVQGNLFSNMKLENKRMKNAGIKTAPFVVLLGVEVPAILTEIACVSNNRQEKKLSRSGYRQKIANYLELGIREYLERRVSESTIAKGEQRHGIYQKTNEGTELYRN